MPASAPVTERVAIFRFPRMDAEKYDDIRCAWNECLAAMAYTEETINNWSVQLPPITPGCLPDLSKTELNLNKGYRYWRPDKRFCSQLYPDFLTFNLISKPDAPGSYPDLKQVASDLLIKWRKGFQDPFTEISLQYVNVFTEEHMRPFKSAPDTIEAGRAFKVWQFPSGLGPRFRFPYHLDFILDHHEKSVPCDVHVSIALGEKAKKNSAVANAYTINLVAQYCQMQSGAKPDEWQTMDALHDEIRSAFKAIIGDEMLQICGVVS